MSTIELSKNNYDKTVKEGGIVLVDCWAGWCRPCAAFAPIYEKVAARNPDHVFGKLDAQSEPDLVSALGIEHIPALLVYRDGVLLFRQAGSFGEETLQDIVRQAESLDMETVLSDSITVTSDRDSR